MANRGIIRDVNGTTDKAIYMPWNSGYDSVKPILDACRLLNLHTLEDIAILIEKTFAEEGVVLDTYGSRYQGGTDNGEYLIDLETLTIKQRINGFDTEFNGEQSGHDYFQVLNLALSKGLDMSNRDDMEREELNELMGVLPASVRDLPANIDEEHTLSSGVTLYIHREGVFHQLRVCVKGE